jgi:3-oxoacyl-[acyl-carrier protein] reductase
MPEAAQAPRTICAWARRAWRTGSSSADGQSANTAWNCSARANDRPVATASAAARAKEERSTKRAMADMRTVFVAGASSDIGLAVCRRYLAAGWRVIGHFRTPRAELDALKSGNFEPWQADFADTDTLERALQDDKTFFHRADALINLAAVVRPSRFEDATAADILATLAANLVPGLLLMRTMGSAMVRRGFGRIVHASSIGVKFGGGANSFTYSLSKHAQEFIPFEARHWASEDVFVNVLRIGVTDTRAHASFVPKNMPARVKMIPAQRMAHPIEIAETIYWLGSETNGFVTGQVINVSGGE